MPSEASHDDIIRRVESVERTQEAMQAQIAQIGKQAERAAVAATDNRKHFDEQMTSLRKDVNDGHKALGGLIADHRDDFQGLRGEIRGGIAVVKWGLPLGMTALIAVVGWALT